VVPVVRDADRKSFAEIEQAIEALAKKTREGALSLEDLRGGTFTITNGGVFGSLLSTPILNPPRLRSSACTRSSSDRLRSTARSSLGR